MWHLVEVNHGVDTVRLIVKEPCVLTIGRLNCDLVLPNKSVSQKHATLRCSAGESLSLTLTDHSRFGTTVNGRLLIGNECCLSDGDNIAFGDHSKNPFIVRHKKLHIIMSSMRSSMKERIQKIANQLNGSASNEWSSDCTHLVMPNLVVTSKVVCALLAAVPIVTPEYMEKMLEASLGPPFLEPKASDYLPALKEARFTQEDSHLFMPDVKRRTLFRGKMFFVFNESKHAQLIDLVRLGGGEVILFDNHSRMTKLCRERRLTMDARTEESHIENTKLLQSLLRLPGVIVIHCQNRPASNSDREWQGQVYCALREIRRRPILESELGFAVISASVDQYCNPERRCPEKLYLEAGVSQANSINPFHLESQNEELPCPNSIPVLNSNGGNVLSKPLKPSTESSSVRENLSSRGILFNNKENYPPKLSNLLPPSELKPPASKTRCFAADLEAFSPPVNRSRVSNDWQRPSLVHTTMISNFQSDLPGVDSDQCLDSGLAALESMPSLLSTIGSKLTLASEVPDTGKERLISRHPTAAGRNDQSVADALVDEAATAAAAAAAEEEQSTGSTQSVASAGDNRKVGNNVSYSPGHRQARKPDETEGGYGWLSKEKYRRTHSADENDPKVTEVEVNIVHFRVGLNNTASLTGSKIGVGHNYKTFRKIWPLYISPRETNQGNEKTAGARTTPLVRLMPYRTNVRGEEMDVLSPEGSKTSQAYDDPEGDKINHLFDQMCQLPKARCIL